MTSVSLSPAEVLRAELGRTSLAACHGIIAPERTNPSPPLACAARENEIDKSQAKVAIVPRRISTAGPACSNLRMQRTLTSAAGYFGLVPEAT